MEGDKRYCYREVLPFIAMITVECSNVGLNTLFKAARRKGLSYYVFLSYSYAIATLILFPLPFIFRRYFGVMLGYIGISYSSPTLCSAISNLTPAFTFILAVIFRMEKLALRSSSTQAKIIGTIVSISGALVVVLYKGPAVVSSASPSSFVLPHLLQDSSENWVIGSLLFTAKFLLISVWNVLLTQIMKTYPAELVVVLLYNICAAVISATVGSIAETNSSSWRVTSDIALITIVYSGFLASSLTTLVHTWGLHLKGPVYISIFSPLSIAIAAAMGAIFLGDILHIGRHTENVGCPSLNLDSSRGCEIDLNVVAQCHSPNSIGIDEQILGMEFCDHESAFIFYRDYGKRKGFDVRKNHQKKNKAGFVTSITIVCSKEGFRKKDKRHINPLYQRPNKRVGCKVHMKCLLQKNGNYKIVSFEDDHNHELVPTPMKYMLRTNRHMSEAQKAHADMVDKSGISIKATVELMGREVGGREHLGFMDKDYRNYIHRKRMMAMAKGDAGAVLRYFHKKQLESPSFFYSIQLDEDDMITNMFWADSRSISDYNLFGDVICFDTTYRTNKCDRPFAPLVGVNHHKQSIIFGAALLYDETTESFKWLFETFLGAMSNKKPMTIITDECAAMARAISDVFPETQHRLCVWHLYQNAAKNLSSVFNGSKQFAKDFGDCVYEYEDESEWQLAWDDMLKKYNLQQNTWLNDKYKLREKWALVYGRHTFTADMKSTQRSESMNNVLKHYLNPSLDIIRFFEHYERVLADRRHEELKADFKMIHTTPVLSASVEMLRHGADVYTPEVFKLFQEEYMRWGDYNIDKVCKNDMTSEYKVYHTSKTQDHLVKFDSSTETITCSCMKFNFVGILCAHALKVLDKKNVKKIPPQYIMKRWTRDAKARNIIDYHGLDVNDNSKESMGNLYSHLCRNFREIATFAAEDNNLFTHAHKRSVELLKELQDMKKKNCLENVSLASTSQVETALIQKEPIESMPQIEPRGIKRKPTVGRPRNRIKSALEKNKPKTTVKSKKGTAKRRLLTEEAVNIDISSPDQNVTGYGSQTVNISTQDFSSDCYNSQVDSTTTNGAQYFDVLPHQAIVHSGISSTNQNFGADRIFSELAVTTPNFGAGMSNMRVASINQNFGTDISYPGLAVTRPNFGAGTSNMGMSSITQNFGASSNISTNTSYSGMTFTSHNLDAGTSNTRMAYMNQNVGDVTSWQENMSYSELLQGLSAHHQNKVPQNMHDRRDPL